MIELQCTGCKKVTLHKKNEDKWYCLKGCGTTVEETEHSVSIRWHKGEELVA